MTSVQVKVEQSCTLTDTDGTYLFSYIHPFNLTRRFGNRPVSSCYARIIFQGDLAGSTESKQLPIELLYWYKWPAKTSRITVLNIWKLYLYLFTLNCIFTLIAAHSPFKKLCARSTWKLAYVQQTNPKTSSNSP